MSVTPSSRGDSESQRMREASSYPKHIQDGIKDTFESIIVALILAFVFRAFVVEAFVIPTGSMAPTLYGAHGTVICDNCGTQTAYGLRDLEDPRQIQMVRRTDRVTCPNCGYISTDLRVSDDQMNPERGDRILVLKWPLDFGGKRFEPARWDVTVFKDPSDGATNFIKRLAGLPNEVLMILQGDVYTVPLSELSERTLQSLDELRHEKHLLLTGQRVGRLQAPPAAAMSELDRKLTPARKSPEAQSVLWFNVYNHDYTPRREDSRQPRWHAPAGEASGWEVIPRRLKYSDQAIPGDEIELVNGDYRATVAYNITERAAPTVHDHRVSFFVVPESESGSIAVRLAKLGRAFTATVQMDGHLSIQESAGVAQRRLPVNIEGKIAPLTAGRAFDFAFENVDYRLALYVNGAEVLASDSDRESSGFYGPDVRGLRTIQLEHAPVAPRIIADGGSFELLHVQVLRDVHYYNDGRFNSLGGLHWAPREGWGSPTSPMLLREGEFFMLGDNTAASKDSRLWDRIGPHLLERGEAMQLGAVPRDQLIGRAFFVYWPSGQRIDWLPLLHRVGIIPDVGRMRWIR